MVKDKKTKLWLSIPVLAVLVVISLVAGKYISVFSTDVLHDQEKWGQFGDYFGGVLNPILSFFAFVALLITMHAQFSSNEDGERRHSEQLREQRLFQLVELINKNALSTKLLHVGFKNRKYNEWLYGREAQHQAFMWLRDKLDNCITLRVQIDEPDQPVFEGAQEAFEKWKAECWEAMGFYVDSVFLVIEFVIKESSSDDFKLFSLRMLRAQMSQSERLLVWYSAMFTVKYTEYLKPMLETGFIDDCNDSLGGNTKYSRELMVESSLAWARSRG